MLRCDLLCGLVTITCGCGRREIAVLGGAGDEGVGSEGGDEGDGGTGVCGVGRGGGWLWEEVE